MKRFIITLGIFTLFAITAAAQPAAARCPRLDAIEDKMALKALVDTFSILADVKNVDAQLFLFTPDALLETTANGNTTTLRGRREIGEAFKRYLSLFDVVYHLNGQQTVSLDSPDTATGIAYCLVIMTGGTGATRTCQTHHVVYHDTYRKIDGRWHIAHRKSDFVWTKTENIDRATPIR